MYRHRIIILRMSFLLPQFKCVPDTFSFHTQNQLLPTTTQLSKGRETLCSLSTVLPPASTSTTVLDLEKLRLLSLEPRANSSPSERPWMYIDAVSPPSEANLGQILPEEALLASDDAIIAAAAAEAVALARAALKLAQDTAKIMGSTDLDEKSETITNKSNDTLVNRTELTEISQNSSEEKLELEKPISEADDLELELLEAKLLSGRAVRSNRQVERKARRRKAAEKAAANVVSVKSGSTGKKKRKAFPEIDHSDPLRFIRATTSSSKLLTVTEEQELSAGIQDLLKLEALQEELVERCDGEPTFAQWASAAGLDQKAMRKRLSYGTYCKDRMIKSNIRLVISIAKNYQGAGMNLQDLIQEGCRGLVRGAEKFDASKGFKFSTYAHWWIKQAVRKSLSDQSRTIRLPFHMVEATYRVKEARKKLLSENGTQPNNEQVAEAAGLSMKRLQAVLLTPKAPRSLDQKVGINQDLKPSEVTADPEAETLEEILKKQFMKKDLEKVLDTLNPREKQVIRWRFGLDDGRMKTLQEIGELMGVSRERIRQIESCAFRKLKNKRRTKNLQQYLVA